MRKLVRDKIPDIIKAQDGVANTEIASGDMEYCKLLTSKLQEEVLELLSANTKAEKIEEMADVLEVLDAICEFNEIDMRSVMDTKSKKFAERGGFGGRIVLIK